MLYLGIILFCGHMLLAQESFLKIFFKIKKGQLILPKWENVRIFSYILVGYN